MTQGHSNVILSSCHPVIAKQNKSVSTLLPAAPRLNGFHICFAPLNQVAHAFL